MGKLRPKRWEVMSLTLVRMLMVLSGYLYLPSWERTFCGTWGVGCSWDPSQKQRAARGRMRYDLLEERREAVHPSRPAPSAAWLPVALIQHGTVAGIPQLVCT